MNKYLTSLNVGNYQFEIEENAAKLEITSIYLIGSVIMGLVYVFVGYFISEPVILYTNALLLGVYSLLWYLIKKVSLLKIQSFYIVAITVGVYIQSYILPRSTLFFTIYAVIFFTLYVLIESRFIKSIVGLSVFIIITYLSLEFRFLNHNYVSFEKSNNYNVIFYFNAVVFSLGLLACSYFLIESKNRSMKQILTRENNLVAILENSQRAIWSIDRDYSIITANSNFNKFILLMKNHNPEVGESGLVVMDNVILTRKEWKSRIDKVFKNKKITEELTVKFGDNIHYFELSIYPMLNNSKDVIGAVFFGKDISKRKNSAQILISKNEELTKANTELDKLVYRASHDLKAPLMSVLGLINITELEFKDKISNSKNFELMRTSIKRLDGFIKDMIDLSRNSRLAVTPSEINFNKTIDDIIKSLHYYQNANFIKINKVIKLTKGFYTDVKRLEIVINNLLSNAIKYHTSEHVNPYVNIIIKEFENGIIINIEDNGKGIAQEHLNKIFDMFYRADNSSEGSGIGLYIVRETVQKMGGQIKVSSLQGVGTKFEIRLPNLNV
ncbi:MAG: hypothetical protein RLZZ175_237 [Bacteroidota bacterium]|jgi:signal transduction histidine kinase